MINKEQYQIKMFKLIIQMHANKPYEVRYEVRPSYTIYLPVYSTDVLEWGSEEPKKICMKLANQIYTQIKQKKHLTLNKNFCMLVL